jgi:hypothetical protein
VQNATLWRALDGGGKTVVEDIEFDDEQPVGNSCATAEACESRCGSRGVTRSLGYDAGEGRWRWAGVGPGWARSGSAGGGRSAGGLSCAWPRGGGRDAAPRTRRTVRHTCAFEEQVACLVSSMLEERGHRTDAPRLAHRRRHHHRSGLETIDEVRRQAWNAARRQPGGTAGQGRWSPGRASASSRASCWASSLPMSSSPAMLNLGGSPAVPGRPWQKPYQSSGETAAVLLESVVRDCGLVGSVEKLGWLAVVMLYGWRGRPWRRLTTRPTDRWSKRRPAMSVAQR